MGPVSYCGNRAMTMAAVRHVHRPYRTEEREVEIRNVFCRFICAIKTVLAIMCAYV